MPRFKVTVFHDIGDAVVEAEDEEEAKQKVDLLKLFNNGYSGNLQKRVKQLPDK